MDFKEVANHYGPQSFDLVVSNPPYRRIDSGRINPNSQKAIARHELTGALKDVFGAGNYLLPQGGRLAVIYPATRLGHLLAMAHQCGFSPKELTIIYSQCCEYSRHGEPARLVHLECRKGGGEELHIAPPFFIYREKGVYTEAMQAIYEADVQECAVL
jgi:tRNA1Val (adenine37-N6)-methyltransferase